MNSPANRRGFLRGLTTLPLIGGGVTLIGAPSAVAEPVTSELLDSYDAWLFYERRYLRFQRYAGADKDLGYDRRFVIMDTESGKRFDWLAVDNAGGTFHNQHPHPTDRAALVLSAVGRPTRRGRRFRARRRTRSQAEPHSPAPGGLGRLGVRQYPDTPSLNARSVPPCSDPASQPGRRRAPQGVFGRRTNRDGSMA